MPNQRNFLFSVNTFEVHLVKKSFNDVLAIHFFACDFLIMVQGKENFYEVKFSKV